jgi:DeoR/GlpR family transcriptional regulator of sugar metabolism
MHDPVFYPRVFFCHPFSPVSTILFGGIISRQAMALVGPDTIAMIRNFHADELFLGANAVTPEKGLMTPNRLQADVKKELIKIASEVIVVADSSKIDKTALFAFCPLTLPGEVARHSGSRIYSSWIGSLPPR